LLSALAQHIHTDQISIVLVNNGSTDDTQDVIDKHISKYSFATSITIPINKGYGFGIFQGLKITQSPFIGWMHADLQTDPQDLIRALSIIRQSPEKNLFVKGRRRGRPFLDRLFTSGMSIFTSVILGRVLVDVNAQPNIFSRALIESFPDPPHDFSFDLYYYLAAKKAGFTIFRFNTIFPPRKYGSSSWNSGLSSRFSFARRTLLYTLSLRQHI